MKLDTKNTKILIIGSTGFIGYKLRTHFVNKRFRVFGVGRRKSSQHNYAQINLQDYKSVHELFNSFNPDVCIYAAGTSTVESIKSISDYSHDRNCLLNVLTACVEKQTKRIIFISSSHASIDSKEDASVYGNLKKLLEQIALDFIKSHNLPITIMRFVNIYGPGDKHLSRIIPKTIYDALTKREIKLWGNGTQVRQYLYIDDAIDAFDKVLKMNTFAIKKYPILYFGSPTIMSAVELVESIVNEIKLDIPIFFGLETTRKERDLILVESSIANKLLDWHPKINIHIGINRTINWLQNNLQSITNKQRRNE
jgi:nucleoside-diphosphate-sugar epimerase